MESKPARHDTISNIIETFPNIVVKTPKQTLPSAGSLTYPPKTRSKPIVTIVPVFDDYCHKDEPQPIQPPKDKGRAAISVLIAVIVLDGAMYGFTLAYGVFQEYYNTQYTNSDIASWIGVLSGGIPYLGAPLVTWCCQRYTLPRQCYIWVGFILCVLGLFISAFISALPGLIVTQGLIYGVGTLLCDMPLLIILNTWFDKRRGVAYGIVFASSDLFGVAYTFIASDLLHRYSFQVAMLVFAGLIFIIAAPAMLVLREWPNPISAPRLPSHADLSGRRRNSAVSVLSATRVTTYDLPFSPSTVQQHGWSPTKPRKRYYQRSAFYLFNLLNFLQSCAWYLPFIYLPSFVTSLGHSKHIAAAVLATGNLVMVVGDLAFGKLSDKVHVNILIIISTSVSAVATFVLWGFVGSGTNSIIAIFAFIAVYGCFGGGFVALWARMGTIFGEKDAQMVYSTLCFGRGLGGILSGPISQILLQRETPKALRILGKGPYGGIIMFVGMCTTGAAIVGVCAMLALWLKKDQIVEAKEQWKEGEKTKF